MLQVIYSFVRFADASVWSPAAMILGQVVAAVGVGRRPLVPQGVNGGLRALVERCWAQDARARPRAHARTVKVSRCLPPLFSLSS